MPKKKELRDNYRYVEATPLARVLDPKSQPAQQYVVSTRAPVSQPNSPRRTGQHGQPAERYLIAQPVQTTTSDCCRSSRRPVERTDNSNCCSPRRLRRSPRKTTDGFDMEEAQMYLSTADPRLAREVVVVHSDAAYREPYVPGRTVYYPTHNCNYSSHPNPHYSPQTSPNYSSQPYPETQQRHSEIPSKPLYEENVKQSIERKTVADGKTQVVTTDEVTRTIVKSDQGVVTTQVIQNPPQVTTEVTQSPPRVMYEEVRSAPPVRRSSMEEAVTSDRVLEVWQEELAKRPVYSMPVPIPATPLPELVEEDQEVRYLLPSEDYNRRRNRPFCYGCRRNCSIS